MTKRLLLTALLIIGLALVARAQNDQREIYTALAYGETAFEPETWLASAAELGTRTTATWRNDSEGALAYLDYLHYDEGFDPEDMDDVFGPRWFDVTLANYEGWRELRRCQFEDELRLHEFSLQFNNLKYTMRYWIQPVEDNTRVLTLFVLYPTDQFERLNEYAERLFPGAAACEELGVG